MASDPSRAPAGPRSLHAGVYALVLSVSVGASIALVLPRVLHPHVPLKPAMRVPTIPPPRGARVDEASAPPSPSPSVSIADVAPVADDVKALCPSDMLYVRGEFCPFVAHRCIRGRKTGTACEEYAPEVLCEGTIREARFCIDRYEYPNEAGAKPVVLVDFEDAKHTCESESKRLCTVDEWQFACEGVDIVPLPNGFTRANSCNVDRQELTPLLGAAHSVTDFASEVMRLDERDPSGTHAACVSPFGVYDLVGNVAEWAENPAGKLAERPFHSAVLGASFGQGEAKCRSADFSIPDTATSHRVGFRCCSDAGPRPKSEKPIQSHPSRGGFRPIVDHRERAAPKSADSRSDPAHRAEPKVRAER